MYNIHDWTISRQLWWGHRIPVWHCGDCNEVIVAREAPTSCPKCGGAKARTGYRRPRHLVFLRPSALHYARLARENARSGSLLSDHAPDHRLRHSVLLGCAHDHVRLPLHGWHHRTRLSSKPAAGRTRKTTAFPSAMFIFTLWCATPSARNVEDQGQRARPARHHRALRHRCHAIHAGRDGRSGHRHCVQRKPDRRLSRIRQ